MTSEVMESRIGLHRGVDFDDYAKWEAVNASKLNGFSRTAAHVLYEHTHGGKERTPALDLGWLFHVAVLEPERYERDFAVAPKCDKRTKVGKALYAKFEAEHPDATIVDEKTDAKVRAMRESVMKHKTAGPFLASGVSELSGLWEDTKLGVLCKMRTDHIGRIGNSLVVADLKHARDASRRAFERATYSYGYHIQAAHYLEGLDALAAQGEGGTDRPFVFVVVEHDPPYCVACYELDDAALDEGRSQRERRIRYWKQCVETQTWPGYGDGVEVSSLPAWAFKEYIDG